MSNNKSLYENEGYLIKRNFFEIDLIRKIYTEVFEENDNVKNNLLKHLKQGFISKNDIAIENNKIKYLKNPQNYFNTVNLLIQSSLLNLVYELMDENVYVDTIEMHQKFPGASETPPHQDNFYFCLEKGKSLTAYIPLNNQSSENGSLAVVPGSHKFDIDHTGSSVTGFSSGIELTEQQKNKIDHYELKAGDLSLHHCNIIHLAPANSSNVPRLNIAIRIKSFTDKIDKLRLERYNRLLNSSVRIS